MHILEKEYSAFDYHYSVDCHPEIDPKKSLMLFLQLSKFKYGTLVIFFAVYYLSQHLTKNEKCINLLIMACFEFQRAQTPFSRMIKR